MALNPAENESTGQAAPKSWVILLNNVNIYLSQDLFGGHKWVRMSTMVNLHKFMSAFVVAALMILFRNYSTDAWVYLALHGTYGFCWMMKHFAFRDARWDAKVTTGGAIVIFLFLATYWIAPYLLISGAGGVFLSTPGNWLIAISIAVFAMGLAIMIGSDSQKYYSLKQKKDLIREGMFRYIRHPNYLGEMMVYASFALLARHWIPWLVLAFWWIVVFLTNMLMIEASLSRYSGWKEYKSRTGMLLPKLF